MEHQRSCFANPVLLVLGSEYTPQIQAWSAIFLYDSSFYVIPAMLSFEESKR